MPTTILLDELETTYKKAIKALKQKGVLLTPDTLVQLSLRLFHEFKVKGINKKNADADMLLFQYGSYDWMDGKGERFSFDITRQLIKGRGQGTFYQLSWTLFYDPAPFAGISRKSSWNIYFESLEEWEKNIRSSDCFPIAMEISPKATEFYFTPV